MGEDAGPEGGQGRELGNWPLSRARLVSYFWGVINGIILLFTVELPPTEATMQEKFFVVVRILGNTILVGFISLLVWGVGRLFGQAIGGMRVRATESREARVADMEAGGGEGGGGEGGGERPPRAPLINKGNVLGTMLGLLGGLFLVYDVAPPENPYVVDVVHFLAESIGSLVFITLSLGGLGFLVALFARRTWIGVAGYFGPFIFTTVLVAGLLFYLGRRPLTAYTPGIGGLVSLLLIVIPVLEVFLIFRLMGRWRREA